MPSSYLEDLFGLDGQTAVVIGGAGVLGGALGGLAQAGAHVVVADLTEEGCQARVHELQKLGGKASFARSTSPRRVDREPAGRRPSSRPAGPTSWSTAPA